MSLWIIFISVIGLASLVWLFRIEARRQERIILTRLRGRLDSMVERAHYRLTHISMHVGTGAFRLMLHFTLHKLLALVMGGLQVFERAVSTLQQRNRQVAKVIRDEQTKTHLDLIAEHQESNALSEEEKQKLKDRAIEP